MGAASLVRLASRRSAPAVPRASVDLCNARRVAGWAFDPAQPDEPLELRLRVDGRVVATLVADLPRPDLAAAGFGDGRHGFEHRFERELGWRDGATISLECADGRVLSHPELAVAAAHPAAVTIESIDVDGIAGSVLPGARALGEAVVACVYADGERVASVALDGADGGGVRRFAVALPARLHDGVPHVFEVELTEGVATCRWECAILPAIPTDWATLREGARHVGIEGLAPNAAERYAQLRVAIRRAATRGDDAAWMDNLSRAHDVLVEGHEGRRDYPPLTLPVPAPGTMPAVSVIVPVHDQLALTYQCIASLILGAGDAEFETILVDDRSNDGTASIESIVDGLTVVRNEENLGFLHSCRRGAEAARGEHLVFLNNDTEVGTRWLDEMLEVFARYPRTGAVGARLVYPDGRLQDAGGIVWSDGVPWNSGHGQNPDAPEWNHVREVDYLTGAALMVSRQAWDQVGGFAAEYAPAYYEDTDLSFRLRDAGYRTLYCPHARVVHHEGGSHGTDVEVGVKRHQITNAATFRGLWRDAFAANGERGGEHGADVFGNKDRNRDFRVLMIDHAFPCLGQDAGSYAAVQELRLLQELGAKITFLPHNLEHRGEHVRYLQRLGVECIHAPFHTSAIEFVQARGREFDAVYITRYDVAERLLDTVREHTTAKVLFNNADLHFLREMRAALSAGETDLSGPRATRDRELAVMDKVDAVLSYNELERTLIASHLMRDEHIHRCPWVVQPEPPARGFAARDGIVFLGGFAHPPNREAATFFVTEVMPRLAERLPGTTLRLWGSGMDASVEALARDNVVVEGYARHLGQVFDTPRVFVAPLLSGAGIKGKVLDAAARGVPTVLSPVAAESTGLVDGVSTLIADDVDAWVEHIAALHESPERWEAMSRRSLDLIEQRYSPEAGMAAMREVLDSVGLVQSARTRGGWARWSA